MESRGERSGDWNMNSQIADFRITISDLLQCDHRSFAGASSFASTRPINFLLFH